MTIVIVIPSLRRGGAERVAANMALYWARQGMRVVVVTLDRPGPDEYDLGPAVSRVGLDLLAASAGIMQAIANNLRRLFALRRTVRAHRPDVVIGFMLSANVLVALACQGLRIRSIGCERTHPPADTPGRAWQAARRLTYRLLSAVTAQTQRSADWLSTHASPRRMAIIPNPLRWPIHPGEPVVGPGTFCRAGRQIILGVGRLSAEKGFGHLLDAFATICGSRPDWDLIILGEGPDRAALERQGRNLGIADRLKLPGAVGNIADWYDRASIFALSSLFEGFPNALAEAMASGLSVVSFDCETGPREIIRHGVDGLLVPVGDTAALADNLAALMNDASLRNQLAARAVEIRERLSEDRVMQEWDRLFQAIGVGTSDTRSRRCAME